VSFSGRFPARKENHCKKDWFDYLAGVVGNVTQPMDRLLLIDDEADVQYSFRRIFDSPEIELNTAASGEEGLRLIPKLKPVLVIMDIRMGGLNGLETLRRLRQLDPKLLVIMMTAYGTTQTAIEAMKLGAYDYLLKPFDVPRLKQIVQGALKAARDMKQVVSYQPLLESEDYDQGIVGRSEAMQNVFKLIGQLAGSDATALITGESGTGKELVARAIYHHSQRSKQPFIAINCAAIPENLLESELFGHEKGAFTARRRSASANSNNAISARFFWTRLATCRWQRRRKFCGCCSPGHSNESGTTNRSR
jgi:two-component system nitrogen regulation response regulator GlnG